jgi:hypothetical protein
MSLPRKAAGAAQPSFDFSRLELPMTEQLPEVFVSDDGRRVSAPTYEALSQVQLILASAETGQAGPTLLEVGEIFTSDAVPSHAWLPLNRAAGEKFEAWVNSLPLDGKNIPQELITEAAFQLRPREGDPEFPMDQWWPHVLRLAAKMADEKRGKVAKVTPGFRPMAPNTPPMPFASTGPIAPDPGRAPAQHQPQTQATMDARAQRQNRRPPMPNTAPAAPAQTTT